MTGQLALALRDEGMARSVEPLSDQARIDFDRILKGFIQSGRTFSADDLREALDIAQIPTSARGGLISGAREKKLIHKVGEIRSTHPKTRGKKVNVYSGSEPYRMPCQACDGHGYRIAAVVA